MFIVVILNVVMPNVIHAERPGGVFSRLDAKTQV